MDMDGDLSQEAMGSGMQAPRMSRASQAQVTNTRHADFQGEAAVDESTSPNPGFSVTLDVYQGPFDVLLGLLANKRLELTEVSLSAITEEFIAYVRRLDFEYGLDEASAFLDVAAVLIVQ